MCCTKFSALFPTEGTSNCKVIGHFAIENRHFSGEILHYLCFFNRKFKMILAYILQFATVALVIMQRTLCSPHYQGAPIAKRSVYLKFQKK